MATSRFAAVKQGPAIEVFALNRAFVGDSNPNKVNLGVGAYRTDEGKPWILPVVRKVEKDLAEDETQNHEYLPVLGLEAFTTSATNLALGKNSAAVVEGRAFGVQTLSGTGALRVAAEFLARVVKCKTFYFSKPTWENHNLVFINAGFTDPRVYRYWDPMNRTIDFEGMIDDLRGAPSNSVVIFHACAHNPTGCDPTKEQWKIIEALVREKQLLPLFDAAYQGFATGSLESDSWVIRLFAEAGHEMLVTQSFAKNFGLYNERVGNLVFIVSNKSVIPALRSQITLLIRGMYSNPPNHGARIVAAVLNNPDLFAEWQDCIKTMSNRILDMRKGLRKKLLELGTPSKNQWKHIVDQIGMFSFTGLSSLQVEHLLNEYHIYMLKSGRINMCGLTTKNLDYVANAIHDTVLRFPDNSGF
ncbi:UNVERIFIED_CONTAM: hypothetical protein PYX00_005187 [Menopon gallinae]|uniref:Aspartate aminotransferase n=1 Tax=Menopon gallinae TaxID=328185 RepID=A0AAW2HQD0_9NEOP